MTVCVLSTVSLSDGMSLSQQCMGDYCSDEKQSRSQSGAVQEKRQGAFLDFLQSLKEETQKSPIRTERFLGLHSPLLSLTSPDSSNRFITA